MLVSSYEVADILFCDSLSISASISYYGAQAFTLQSPRASLPLVTCSSPHITSKEEDILHPLGHLILKLGLILPLMVCCSRLKHISFLSVPHMVRILKNLFSLFRWFQLLYMGPVLIVQLFIFLIQLSALFFFQSGRFLQKYSFILDSEVHMHSLRMLLYRRTNSWFTA